MGALETNEIPVALFGPPVGSGCHTLKGQWLPYIKDAVVAIHQGGSGCHTSWRQWLPYIKEEVVAIHQGGIGCHTLWRPWLPDIQEHHWGRGWWTPAMGSLSKEDLGTERVESVDVVPSPHRPLSHRPPSPPHSPLSARIATGGQPVWYGQSMDKVRRSVLPFLYNGRDRSGSVTPQ